MITDIVEYSLGKCRHLNMDQFFDCSRSGGTLNPSRHNLYKKQFNSIAYYFSHLDILCMHKCVFCVYIHIHICKHRDMHAHTKTVSSQQKSPLEYSFDFLCLFQTSVPSLYLLTPRLHFTLKAENPIDLWMTK